MNIHFRPWLALLAIVGFLIATSELVAERPPQKQDDATVVVTGKISKIAKAEQVFGDDGVRTDYTVEITIDKVDKGDGLKKGDTLKAKYFHVTKKPSKAFPGAYGHAYKITVGDEVKLYLVGKDGNYEVIYNSDGIEKLKE